jgi:hypothetical protein
MIACDMTGDTESIEISAFRKLNNKGGRMQWVHFKDWERGSEFPEGFGIEILTRDGAGGNERLGGPFGRNCSISSML